MPEDARQSSPEQGRLTAGDALSSRSPRTAPALRVATQSSIALASVLILGTAALAAFLIDPTWFRAGAPGASAQELFPSSVQGIFLRNMSSALLLYSGVITAGITGTVVGITVGAYFGLFFRLGLDSMGWELTLSRVGVYTLLELSGLIAACAAGLLPILATIWVSRSETHSGIRTNLSAYSLGMQRSVSLIGVASVFLLGGAAVESFVIAR